MRQEEIESDGFITILPLLTSGLVIITNNHSTIPRQLIKSDYHLITAKDDNKDEMGKINK